MRTVKLYCLVITNILLISVACTKNSSILPSREVAEEVEAVVERYRSVLQGNDWFLAYKAEGLTDSVYIKIDFSANGKVSLLSGYPGYHESIADADYSFEGKYTPVLVFSDNSVFGELAQKYNGTQKFKLHYIESTGGFELARSDGYDNARFKLVRINPQLESKLLEQIALVVDRIEFEKEQERLSRETYLKIKQFAEIESDVYFCNLMTTSFSGAINRLDTLNKKIEITYKQTPLSLPTQVTADYTVYPKGIKLSPAITYSDIVLDSIELGDLVGESLEIQKAGNTGAGKMGYMHLAPYNYTLTSDRSTSIVDWLLAPEQQYRPGAGTGQMLYTLNSDSYYSSLVNLDREEFRVYINEHIPNTVATGRLNSQIYFPENKNNSRNIQIYTYGAGGSGNVFMLYRFDISRSLGGNNQDLLNIGLTIISSATYAPHTAAFDAYLKPQFPEEGVNVIPVLVGNDLRLRFVSAKDSRYWVEYVLSKAVDRTLRFN